VFVGHCFVHQSDEVEQVDDALVPQELAHAELDVRRQVPAAAVSKFGEVNVLVPSYMVAARSSFFIPKKRSYSMMAWFGIPPNRRVRQ
jgi:hypothetical protein